MFNSGLIKAVPLNCFSVHQWKCENLLQPEIILTMRICYCLYNIPLSSKSHQKQCSYKRLWMENRKKSLHYKKYVINSLRQVIKLHAVYLGLPSFRYSLSLNCGLYYHTFAIVRFLHRQRDVCKIRMYFKYETKLNFPPK